MLSVVQAYPMFFGDEWDQTITAKMVQIAKLREAVLGIGNCSFQAMSPQKYEVRLASLCCGILSSVLCMS